MITLADLQSQMQHAIGGMPDSRISLANVANDALKYLFNEYEWAWRERPPLTLTAVPNQQYLALPADFGEIVGISRPNREVQLTSLPDLAFRRNLTLVPPPIASVFAAVSHPAAPVDDDGNPSGEQPVPQLELFPTPVAADTYVLTYRAGPVSLVNTTDVPNIPPEFERVLTLVARAMIRDLEEQDASREWDAANAELEKLQAKDGREQANMGQIRGGAVDDPNLRVNFWVGGITSRN